MYIKSARRDRVGYTAFFVNKRTTHNADVAQFFFAMELADVKPKELDRQIRIGKRLLPSFPWKEIQEAADSFTKKQLTS